MEFGSILLVFAVVLLVGLYLYAPIAARGRRPNRTESREVSALQAERDRVLDSLRELDFDNSLGIVPAEDYPVQRAELLQRGAVVLRKLDELVPAAVAASRKLGDDEIESMIAARRIERKGRAAGFCPRCGRPVLVTDKFCSSCGKALS